MDKIVRKHRGAWSPEKAYLLLGTLFAFVSLTLTAHALVTVSNSGLFGDADVVVDSSGTLNLGTASSTAVVIGSSTTPGMIPGSLAVNGTLTLGSASTTGQLLFRNASSSFTTMLQASPSLTSNLTFILPSATGTPGQVLSTDGAGGLYFANASTSTPSQWVSGSNGAISYNGGSVSVGNTVLGRGVPVSLRAPTMLDSSAGGFAVGDIWNVPSVGTWQAAVVTPSTAIWLRQVAPPLPGSILTAKAAYGVCKLVSGYAGNLFTVTRASDSTTLAVAPVASAVQSCANWAAIDTFCAGTTCGVSTLNDQSGGGYDLTQATAADMPQIYGNYVGPFRSISFDSVSSVTLRYMSSATLPITSTRNMAALLVANTLESSSGKSTFNGLFQLGAPGLAMETTNTGVSMDLRAVGTDACVTYPTANWTCWFPTYMFNDTQGAVTGINSTASGFAVFSGASSASVATVPVSKSLTGMTLGEDTLRANGADAAQMEFLGMLVYDTGLTATQSAALEISLSSYFTLTPQVRNVQLIVGNSIGVGYKGLTNTGWANEFAPLLSVPSRIINISTNGSTCSSMVSSLNNYLGHNTLPSTPYPHIAHIAFGTNDIAAGTGVPADLTAIETCLSTMAGTVRAAGAKSIIHTVISRNWAAGFEANRIALNAWERASVPSLFDAVADPGADPVLGCPTCSTNLTYFNSDQVHPNSLGQQHYASWAASAANSLLGYRP